MKSKFINIFLFSSPILHVFFFHWALLLPHDSFWNRANILIWWCVCINVLCIPYIAWFVVFICFEQLCKHLSMRSSAASVLNSAFCSGSSAPSLSPSPPLLCACAGLLSFCLVCYACDSLIPCCCDVGWVLCSVAPVCCGWSVSSHPGTMAGQDQGRAAGQGSTQLNE